MLFNHLFLLFNRSIVFVYRPALTSRWLDTSRIQRLACLIGSTRSSIKIRGMFGRSKARQAGLGPRNLAEYPGMMAQPRLAPAAMQGRIGT
jgi:hypothetical protein